MKEYELTIGYKAVIQVHLKASSEEEAKELAIQEFEKERNRWFKPSKNQKCSKEDDSYKVDGVLDMDSTWNAL